MMSVYITRRQALALFLFVVVVAVIGVNRIEHNTNVIERSRKEALYQSCINGLAILVRFDTFATSMAAIEMKGTKPNSPTYDKAATPTRLERAQTYRNAMVPLPTCSRP